MVYDATLNKANIPVRTASNHHYGYRYALEWLLWILPHLNQLIIYTLILP